MKNKYLIISLIRVDLKHNQLVVGLEQLNLDGAGIFDLGILEMVSGLMQVPEGKIEDRFVAMYVSFMKEATNYELTSRGDNLIPLAELCYRQLKALLEYEYISIEEFDKTGLLC